MKAYPHEDLPLQAHGGFIQNSENNKMPIQRCMDKQMVTISGVTLGEKRHDNTDESPCRPGRRKPDTNTQYVIQCVWNSRRQEVLNCQVVGGCWAQCMKVREMVPFFWGGWRVAVLGWGGGYGTSQMGRSQHSLPSAAVRLTVCSTRCGETHPGHSGSPKGKAHGSKQPVCSLFWKFYELGTSGVRTVLFSHKENSLMLFCDTSSYFIYLHFPLYLPLDSLSP